jgi:hypothetical protein
MQNGEKCQWDHAKIWPNFTDPIDFSVLIELKYPYFRISLHEKVRLARWIVYRRRLHLTTELSDFPAKFCRQQFQSSTEGKGSYANSLCGSRSLSHR